MSYPVNPDNPMSEAERKRTIADTRGRIVTTGLFRNYCRRCCLPMCVGLAQAKALDLLCDDCRADTGTEVPLPDLADRAWSAASEGGALPSRPSGGGSGEDMSPSQQNAVRIMEDGA